MLKIKASEAAVIRGEVKTYSPLRLYHEKVEGYAVRENDEAKYLSTALESFIVSQFIGQTGKMVSKPEKFERDFMTARVDRMIQDESAILECVNANEFCSHHWADGMTPDYIMSKVQHKMHVSGMEKAYVLALIGGRHFEYREIERDEQMIEDIINSEKAFLTNCMVKEEPKLYGLDDETNFLKERYRKATSGTKEGDKELLKVIKEIEKLDEVVKEKKSELKEIENEKEKFRNILRNEMKETVDMVVEGYEIRWRLKSTRRFQSTLLKKEDPSLYNKYVGVNTYRELSIKKAS